MRTFPKLLFSAHVRRSFYTHHNLSHKAKREKINSAIIKCFNTIATPQILVICILLKNAWIKKKILDLRLWLFGICVLV